MAVFWRATVNNNRAARFSAAHGSNVTYETSRTIPIPGVSPSPLFERLRQSGTRTWDLRLQGTSAPPAANVIDGVIIILSADGVDSVEYEMDSSTAFSSASTRNRRRTYFLPSNQVPAFDVSSLASFTIELDDGEAFFGFSPDAATAVLRREVSGTPVTLHTVDVSDPTGTVTYSIVGTPQAGIAINSSTGVISFTANQANVNALPAAGGSFDVVVSAADDTGNTQNQFTLTVDVKAPDTIPMFGTADVDAQVYEQNTQITALTLPAATSGNPPLTYSLSPALPDGLMLNAGTRVVSGTPTASMARTEYTWEVEDEDGDTDSITFFITVNEEDTSPSFSDTVPDQSYVRGTEITALTLPAATGGNAPVTYTLTPALPNGLSRSGFEITGTPSAVQGSTQYTWIARDSDGDTDQITFNIVVNTDFVDLTPTFGNASVSDKSYTEDDPITAFTLPTASSGNAPLTYSLTPNLPAGLRLANREVTGTPTAPQARTEYTWTVTDDDGDTDTVTFFITVAEAAGPVAPIPATGRGWRTPRHWEGKASDGDRADRLGEWDNQNPYRSKIAYSPNNNVYDLTFEWSQPLKATLPAVASEAGQIFVAAGQHQIDALNIGSGAGRAYRSNGTTVVIEDAGDVLNTAYPTTTENDLVVGDADGAPGRLAAPTDSTEYLLSCVNGLVRWRTRAGATA